MWKFISKIWRMPTPEETRHRAHKALDEALADAQRSHIQAVHNAAHWSAVAAGQQAKINAIKKARI